MSPSKPPSTHTPPCAAVVQGAHRKVRRGSSGRAGASNTIWKPPPVQPGPSGTQFNPKLALGLPQQPAGGHRSAACLPPLTPNPHRCSWPSLLYKVKVCGDQSAAPKYTGAEIFRCLLGDIGHYLMKHQGAGQHHEVDITGMRTAGLYRSTGGRVWCS